MESNQQAARRTSDLSLEQLYRKRAIDRENQRNLRQKKRARVDELKVEVQELKRQLKESEAKRCRAEDEASSTRGTIDSVIDTLQSLRMNGPPSWNAGPRDHHGDSQNLGSAVSIDSASTLAFTDTQDLDAQFWTGGANVTFPIDGSVVCDINDFSLDLSSLAAGSDALQALVASRQPEKVAPEPMRQTPPTSGDEFYAGRVEANIMRQETVVWTMMPRYTPPTCHVDRMLLGLIDSLKLRHQIDPTSNEFTHKNFPSVASLLNPSLVEPDKPVASTIAKHVSGVIRVHTLPEKIALLYMMCVLIRWQILSTEENYNAIPVFMRPTATQITVPHPVWVGTIGWPEARDRLIRHMDFTCYEKFAVTINKTFSINWPHNLAGILEGTPERGFVLTDSFVAHIRDQRNWSVGNGLIEAFPFLEGTVTVSDTI